MGEPMHKESFGRDQVVKIINSVMSKVEHAETISRESIFQELISLQKAIEDARAQIGSLQTSDIKDKHIPTATDELDEVIAATAAATGTIMDKCDIIMDTAGKIGREHGDTLSSAVTQIYEACSFQDITGQRIKKVVTTMKFIDDKVEQLIVALGNAGASAGSDKAVAEDTRTGDAALLNGPQSADKAISQDEIDKLLAEFG